MTRRDLALRQGVAPPPPPPTQADIEVARARRSDVVKEAPVEVLFEKRVSYPAKAREARVEGTVRLKVTIEPDGTVSQVKVKSGPGYGLDEAAVEALRQFRFAVPRDASGRPEAREISYNYTFLMDDAPPPPPPTPPPAR